MPGRTFLDEWCFKEVNVDPFDGGQYDSVMEVSGSNGTLLLTYADSATAFETKIMGMFVSVRRM